MWTVGTENGGGGHGGFAGDRHPPPSIHHLRLMEERTLAAVPTPPLPPWEKNTSGPACLAFISFPTPVLRNPGHVTQTADVTQGFEPRYCRFLKRHLPPIFFFNFEDGRGGGLAWGSCQVEARNFTARCGATKRQEFKLLPGWGFPKVPRGLRQTGFLG